MRIGMIGMEGAGHLNPTTTLGHELVQRGHHVTLLGGERSGDAAAQTGLNYCPLGRENGVAAEVAAGWLKLGRLRGLASMRQTGRVMTRASQMVLDDMPAAIDRLALDGLVVDQLSPAAAIVAERAQLPYVVICNALALIDDPYAPPPPLGWTYRRDLAGRLRNSAAKRILLPLYERLAGARTTGVRPLHLAFKSEKALAVLSQQPEFFDFPNESRPDHFHFTAPWNVAGRDDAVKFPWSWLDGRPLVYASMGTMQNERREAYDAICHAVRDLPVQVVLSRGGAESELRLDAPSNLLVVRAAPQLQLLDRASLAITHAGLNTALECVTRAVPMVCLPVTNDQPGVAKRVEWLGLGKSLPVARATPARLRELVTLVLNDPAYRLRALERQQQLPARPGVDLAANVIEQAMTTRRQVTAPLTAAA